MDEDLRHRRSDLERHWQAGVADGRPAQVRPDVLSSWRRSSMVVAPEVSAAPVAATGDVQDRWAQSRLGRASRVILEDLQDLASSGDLMAAITDESVTIAWIAGGRTMTRNAEKVCFAAGACWAEHAVGTNALALAQHTSKPATVFSAEHYAPMVHDWVCYSAPILDPTTGLFLGVIDLSTTWERASGTLLTTATALSRCVEYELAASAPPPRPSPRRVIAAPLPATLQLRTLGACDVRLGEATVPVTRRQMELLVVLSLHPEGLTLDELTADVYGDQPVSASTVKAELSHLRHLLGGRVGSRPYRLVGPWRADHRELLDALADGSVASAVALYRGPLVAASDSPDITGWRAHIDAAIRDAVLHGADPELLWSLGAYCPYDAVVHTATLDALAPGDARRSLAVGRLAAAEAG